MGAQAGVWAGLPGLVPGPGAVVGVRGLPERFPQEEEWRTKGQELGR